MNDVFASFLKNIEKSWRSGAARSLPSPSVGRSLLSNPFLTEGRRDVREVRTLYGRVQAAHRKSLFVDEELLDAALSEIVKNACRDAEIENTDWAAAIGQDALRELLAQEFLSFPSLSASDWSALTLRDVSELRTFLLRKNKQLLRPAETFDLACRSVCTLLTNVLQGLGHAPVCDEASALTLDASVLDALHDPTEPIEFAWRMFFAQELDDAALFESIREQLRRNTMATCRIDQDDPRPASKIVSPTQAKGDCRELVANYLGGTPLASLFESRVPIAVPQDVRFEHTHILGGSGHGKTQLLLHLFHHDMSQEEGPGLIVMDSQGDLVRTLSRLQLLDPDGPLADRFVLIDPTDVEYPVALSLFDVPRERLARYSPAERERLLNGAVEMYEYVFSSLLGAELTQKQGVIFRFLARLLMVIPDATLHTFLDLMEHGDRFREHMRSLDGTARRFFDEEFFHPSFSATKKQIAKRLWGILANPVFERMFAQPRGKLDFFEAMQARKIILISTAKDVLRQEGAEILGRFFLAKITQAVMERATVAPPDREPVFLYIDEAHEYVDDHMALMLNQARKYRVGLTLANQNLDQLPPALRASVMSSTSIKFAGGVSAKDARALAEDMQVTPDFLQSMRKRQTATEFACYVRNRTPRALSVSIPLGAVNGAPQLSDEAWERLVARNREAVCSLASGVAALSELPDPVSPKGDDQTDLRGHGGQEHKQIQRAIQESAREKGFRADIEYPVTGGSVDVAIVAGDTRIAVEASVTTSALHEWSNAEKCLAAGFDEVWLVVTSSRRKAARERAIRDGSDADHASRLRVMTLTEALAAVGRLSDVDDPTRVRGYRVTSVRVPKDEADIRRRLNVIAEVLRQHRAQS